MFLRIKIFLQNFTKQSAFEDLGVNGTLNSKYSSAL